MKNEIKITHPERIIYAKEKISKGDLFEYYKKISPHILPYLENRLISLMRCPQGIGHECFFQRHENISSEFIHELKIKDKNHPPYIYIKDLEGLLTLIQFGVIEIHVWSSKIDKVTQPDNIVFDLDPAPNVPWKMVVEAAADVKLRMDKIGLESFLKTTGGKGLHIFVPIKRKYDFDVIKAFTKSFAQKMEDDEPEKYITNMNKEKRKGKIFIDYLRNDFSSTSIANYSARAREGATVATPLAWEELDYKLEPKKFTVKTVFNHLKKQKTDPWREVLKVKQSLSKSLLKDFGIKF